MRIIRVLYNFLRPFLNQLLKVFISKNRLKDNIIIFSSPRSGSTWIYESISLKFKLKKIDEPFINSRFKLYAKNYINRERFFKSDIKRFTVLNYIKLINDQKLEISNIRNIKQFLKKHQSGVWKILRANYIIEEILESIPHQYAFGLVRNPIDASQSRYLNKWGHHCSEYLSFFDDDDLWESFNLNKANVHELVKISNEFEKYIIGWCFDNLPLLKQNHIPIFKYEDLKNGKLNNKSSFLKLDFLKKSRSVSSKYSKKSNLTYELSNIKKILEEFKIGIYNL